MPHSGYYVMIVMTDNAQQNLSSFFSAALGEGTSHPWQIAVSDSGTELVELVPTVGGTTGPEQPGVHQPTIGILKPLDSAMDGMCIFNIDLLWHIHNNYFINFYSG